MAKIGDLQESFWDWYRERPEVVRDMIDKWPPDRLYWLEPPGQRVTIVAYGEDGTVRVHVSGQWNAVTFERNVFGIDPNNLRECALPSDDEPVGCFLDLVPEGQKEAFMEKVRDGILAAKATRQ